MDERAWIAEGLDKLISLELRPQGFLNNIVHQLYAHAREAAGGPLVWAAATDLAGRVGANDVVYIASGHVHPEILPNGETDGPPGAVALARAIRLGLGARVILLSEPAVIDVMHQTCRAVGMMTLDVTSPNALTNSPPRHIGVMSFPVEPDAAATLTAELVDQSLGAVITVEKIGPNSDGIYNTGLGNDVSDDLSKLDLLVDAAREGAALTIGIGDLGNEIGFGTIQDAAETVANITPGIVTTTATDHLVVAGVSNWGAYAIAAALAIILRRPDIAHTPELEEQAVLACCRAGAVDGLSGGPTYEVDGLHYSSHAALVKVLYSLVEAGLATRRVERQTFEADG